MFNVRVTKDEFVRAALSRGCDEALVHQASYQYSRGAVYALGATGKMGSGKDSVLAEVVAELSAPSVHLSFADALKDEVNDVLGTVLASDDPVGSVSLALSVSPDVAERAVELAQKALGEDPTLHSRSRHPAMRLLLQYWGAEVRRAQNPDYWVTIATHRIIAELAVGNSVYMTDVRYENEAKSLQDLGFWLVRIHVDQETQRSRLLARDGHLPDPAAFSHSSEVSLDTYLDFDLLVNNSGAFEQTVAEICRFVKA